MVKLAKAGMVLALGLGALFPCNVAHAQAVGSYSGTTADGSNIQFAIVSENGQLTINSMSIGFNASCAGGTTFSTSWGFDPEQPVSGPNLSFTVEPNRYFYAKLRMTFNAQNNTVNGTVKSDTAIFAPVSSGPPKKSVFCHTTLETFSAAITPAASADRAAVHNQTR